jgi:hypothetical protein
VLTFARMFLAAPSLRRSQLDELFPMRLTRGASRSTAPFLGDTLRLDLSAMLLAKRYELLDAFQAGFRLEVPASAPEALTIIEATFPIYDRPTIEACRTILKAEGSSIKVRDGLPDDAIRIDASPTEAALAPTIVGAMLRRAFTAGHLDRKRMEDAAAQLGVNLDAEIALSSVALSATAAGRLAGAGVIEQLGRATELILCSEDRSELQRSLDRADDDQQCLASVIAVRTWLTERLVRGEATTLPFRVNEPGAPYGPALIRCLAEVLDVQQRAPKACWIEDRAVSRTDLPGILCLTNILAWLAQAGLIQEERRTAVMATARRDGYGYMSIDRDAIASAILSAPIDAMGLVDTPELSDWRLWFNRDIENLRYLDLAGEVPAEGPVTGEIRRLLDMMALAKDLLASVWFIEEDGAEDRLARANWIWRNFRIGPLALGGDDNAAARRHVALMQLVQLIDLPLMSRLSSSPSSTQRGADYINWLMSKGPSLLGTADPDALADICSLIANQLGRLLEMPPDVDHDVAPALQREMIKIALTFLETLPDDWSDRIIAEGLSGILPARDILVLTFASFQAEVSDVERAWQEVSAKAKDGRSAEAAITLRDKSAAMLTLQRSADGEPVATIRVAERRFPLDPLTTALLDGSEPNGIQAKSYSALFDPKGAIPPTAVEALPYLPNAAARFAAAKTLLDSDLHQRLHRLRTRFSQQRVLSLSDLQLPTPQAISNYLRLDTAAETTQITTSALDALGRVLDPAGIAQRIAGSPFDLPLGSLHDLEQATDHGVDAGEPSSAAGAR